MAAQFHTLTISQIRRETPNAVSLVLDVPPALREEFTYKHGQYLTIRVHIGDKHFNRAYSLCSSPALNEPLTITIKNKESGFISAFINNNTQEGQTIEVMKPMGNFTRELSPNAESVYCLFAGGSGITPIISILKTILAVELKSKVVLFYGNTDEENVIFRKELDQLQEKYNNRLTIIHTLDTLASTLKAITGRLDKQQCLDLLDTYIGKDTPNAQYFICGPPQMMKQVEDTLHAAHIPQNHIHREFFSAPIDAVVEPAPTSVEDNEPKERSVTIRLYGREETITVRPKETILDSAIRNDLDPPYACQIAACCTCRAKVVRGNVHMDSREALTDEEMDDGYVLTCQSHPLTDDVIVDYDQ
ncbi:MAG: 2Fe-2S iron-sulfur cluster binding domain-containing protein [Ignavibacteria bacterium]|jgi:ring-1,2-phenylacetyl-CoA epoxidase subunit PaaE|nr:2Fe-2S iron-sulfur cluster binding domain-containing protein [Ignavibacteria bacterium]